MNVEPKSGGLSLGVVYHDGHSDSLQTDLYLHACSGLEINGEAVGTNVLITLRGRDARNGFHELIQGDAVRAAAIDSEQFLLTQLAEIHHLSQRAQIECELEMSEELEAAFDDAEWEPMQ